jgi:hypothetical protein
MSEDGPRCPQRRSEGSRQSSPGSGESPATARFAAGHGQLRAFCPARCAWSVFLLLVGNGVLFGSLVIASRPPGSAGTAHRSRRRKMVSGTHSRDGGATVRFRRVREPESRRMRDRRLAIRARHPVVLRARADAEPRAAWWARTPTPTSSRPRLPAFTPPHSKSGAPEPTSELPRMARLSASPSHRLSAHLLGGLPAAATPRRTSGLSRGCRKITGVRRLLVHQ